MNEFLDDDQPQYLKPSKSSLKRESEGLQMVAAELADLSSAQLSEMGLPEKLTNAIAEAAGMPPKGARKRQLKYIAALLRDMDAEPVKEKLAKLKNQSVHSAREHHKIERWRDRLLSEDNQALTELLEEVPQADRQELRQLIRNAKKEIEMDKPHRFYRQLFRYLKELFGHQ